MNVPSANERLPFSKNKLLQITGNLISNAIKSTPKDGTLTVELDLAMEKDKKTLLIRVKDSAIGLEQENIGHIVKSTSDLKERTADEKGYGFGLTLVKHLIDDLKGTLSIESVPGNGSVLEERLSLK